MALIYIKLLRSLTADMSSCYQRVQGKLQVAAHFIVKASDKGHHLQAKGDTSLENMVVTPDVSPCHSCKEDYL